MIAESITQVPAQVVQIAEKVVPKVMTQAREVIQEVPQVLLEEQLVQVPQTQVAEVVRQVPKEQVQVVQRGIPRITTQVAERVVNVPCDLISETAVEVPQVQTVEVLKQTAAVQQQRIVQTGRQWEQAVGREVVVGVAPAERGLEVFQAPVGFVREGVTVQPTVVERVSPIMTQEIVAPFGGAAYIGGGVAEVDRVNAFGQVVERDLYAGGVGMGGIAYGAQVVETMAPAPMYTQVLAAPTYATGGVVTEMVGAPTYATGGFVTEVVGPPTMVTEVIGAPTYATAGVL